VGTGQGDVAACSCAKLPKIRTAAATRRTMFFLILCSFRGLRRRLPADKLSNNLNFRVPLENIQGDAGTYQGEGIQLTGGILPPLPVKSRNFGKKETKTEHNPVRFEA